MSAVRSMNHNNNKNLVLLFSAGDLYPSSSDPTIRRLLKRMRLATESRELWRSQLLERRLRLELRDKDRLGDIAGFSRCSSVNKTSAKLDESFPEEQYISAPVISTD